MHSNRSGLEHPVHVGQAHDETLRGKALTSVNRVEEIKHQVKGRHLFDVDAIVGNGMKLLIEYLIFQTTFVLLKMALLDTVVEEDGDALEDSKRGKEREEEKKKLRRH